MDLERLDEALEWWSIRDSLRKLPSDERVAHLAIAARAYRDLANGERVMWCDEHKASADEDTCWSGAVFSGSTPCRITSKLLIDYPTEEE